MNQADTRLSREGREANYLAKSGRTGNLELLNRLVKALLIGQVFEFIMVGAGRGWEKVLERNIRFNAEIERLSVVKCYVLRLFEGAEKTAKVSR